jgi:hypothetical protein
MYEGFDSYDDFAESITDGFTNCLNEYVTSGDDLLCNMDGYSLLCAVFGAKLSVSSLRAINDDQLKLLQKYLEERGLKLSKFQLLDCVRGTLRQSIGEAQLDNFNP